MKKTALAFILGSALFSMAVLAPSCAKTGMSNSGSTIDLTITGLLMSAANTTLISQVLSQTGQDTLFNGTGPFTFFTPLDTGFIAAGLTSSAISATSSIYLKNLVLYHTIAGEAVYSGSFQPSVNTTIIMANGDSAYVSAISSLGLFVNGIQVSQADVTAKNGVVDALERPLVEQTGNLLQTIGADTTLSYLYAALARASQGSSNLDSLLSNGGPYTIFAPTNAAFQASSTYNTLAAINAAPPDSLTALITYHGILGRKFTCNITTVSTQTALNGYLFTYTSTASTPQIQGLANTTPSNILTSNRMASNGVLYTLDQVLQPY